MNRFFRYILIFLATSLPMIAQPIEKSELRDYNGRPTIFLDDEPQIPQFYALTDWPSGRHSYESTTSHNIAQFAKAGIRLFQLDIWFEDMLSEDGVLDITEAIRQVDGVLVHRPDAGIMFRLHVNAPLWWLERHPEEWTRFADAQVEQRPYRPSYMNYMWKDLAAVPQASYASQKWQNMMEEKVAEFCQRLAGTPQGYHVISIQIAGGLYGEHHNWAFTKHDPDVSEPMLKFFRSYLQEKYGSDKALRKAWNDPDASIESSVLPMMERHETSEGIFRDPQREMWISDYFEALNRCISRSIIRYASVVKNSWPRPIMFATFYGYYYSLFGRQATGGHLCEEDILNCKDIDIICAPQAYNKNSRRPGGPGLSRGLIESVFAHGKLWLDEMDQPSHFGYVIHGGLEVLNKEKSVQALRKFVLESFVRGGGMWYYDFGPHMTSGWWDDPAYMNEVKAINEIEKRYFCKQYEHPADVLLVYDTKVFLHTASREIDDPVTDQSTVNISGVNAFRSGASVATCYLSDIRSMPLDKYKAVVFMNCFFMEPELRRWILKNVASGGRSLFWLTAPGYNDGKSLSLDNVSSCCAMKMKKADEPSFFAVNDPDANMIDGLNLAGGSAAVKHKSGYSTYFLSLPPQDGESWRKLFTMAGCHIYDTCGDSVLAGAGLLMIHTAEGGARELSLRDGKKISLLMSPAQTVVLDARTGEILLQ